MVFYRTMIYSALNKCTNFYMYDLPSPPLPNIPHMVSNLFQFNSTPTIAGHLPVDDKV